MPTTKRTRDELAGLGGEIFDRQVRPALRPEDDGKFVAIDVETGDYEVDEDDYTAGAEYGTGTDTTTLITFYSDPDTF